MLLFPAVVNYFSNHYKPSSFPKEAGGVAFVDKCQGAVLFCQFDYLRQRGDVPIHRKDSVGRYQL